MFDEAYIDCNVMVREPLGLGVRQELAAPKDSLCPHPGSKKSITRAAGSERQNSLPLFYCVPPREISAFSGGRRIPGRGMRAGVDQILFVCLKTALKPPPAMSSSGHKLILPWMCVVFGLIDVAAATGPLQA